MVADLNQLYTIVDSKPIPELNREERESRIFDILVSIEVQKVDPDTVKRYKSVRNTTRDVERIMRMDIWYFDRIADLRAKRMISQSELVREKAIELSYLTDFGQLGLEFLKYEKDFYTT